MARIETKNISVAPAREQVVTNKFLQFGWSLLSSQDVHNESTRYETRGVNDDELWSVTTTTDYVKLVFQRDTELFPDIAKLRKLENDYWHQERVSQNYPSILPNKYILILSALFVIMGFYNMLDLGNVGPGILLIVIGAAIIAARHFLSYIPKKKKALAAYSKCCALEEEIKKLVP